MKRISVALVALGALLLVAGPAPAQEPTPDYPIGAAQISLSDLSAACPGGTTTISGENFLPGVPVSIQFDGEEIASVTPGDDGTLSVTITLPEAAGGTHTITAVQPGSDPASATITCVVAAPGLAVTGGNVQVWMLLVAGLVVVGGVALVAGRRRARRSA
ncbi:MAG: hypothetical protein ACRDHV_00945 [Actinomycetota bacterium]